MAANRRAFCGSGIQRFRRRAAGYPPTEFRGHKQATARPVPAGLSRRQMTSPRGLLRSAPAALARGLRVMAGLAGRRPVAPRPRTAAGRPDAAPHGRPPSPAPRAPAPGRRRTAGAAPGRRRGPGASADRSLGVPRSAAGGPARASPPPRCCTPADGARAASTGNGGSTKQNPPRLAGRASRDSYRLCSPKLHLAVKDINPARDGGAVNRLGQPGYRASRPGCPAHDPAVADGHSSADAAPNPEGCAHSRPRAKHSSPPGSRCRLKRPAPHAPDGGHRADVRAVLEPVPHPELAASTVPVVAPIAR